MTDRERDLQHQVLALSAVIVKQQAELLCERDRFRLVKRLYDESEASREELRRERDELLREVEHWSIGYCKIESSDAEDAERYWRIAADGCWYVVETWIIDGEHEFVDERGNEFVVDNVGPLWGPIPTPGDE